MRADCVVTRGDGRYALIEFAPGVGDEETAKIQLEKLERVISRHNEKLGKGDMPFPLPDLKIILTGGKYGAYLDGGIFLVPVGALRD
ncbi:MAG: hypothetical protein LUD47_00820 [Clostridia bacterium]|nr:hypothetical protein [Clostridia bacterium]